MDTPCPEGGAVQLERSETEPAGAGWREERPTTRAGDGGLTEEAEREGCFCFVLRFPVGGTYVLRQ